MLAWPSLEDNILRITGTDFAEKYPYEAKCMILEWIMEIDRGITRDRVNSVLERTENMMSDA